ncbi:MAG: HAD family acid phosphatase [Acidilobaceae archaeon]
MFDIDGVLIDSSSRLEACLNEAGARKLEELRGGSRERFWSCFLSERYLYLDRPRSEYVRLALDYASRGYAIVIVTGRPEFMKELTFKQLEEIGLFSIMSEALFRKNGDRRSDSLVKIEALKKVVSKYDVVAVYEDSQDVAEEIKRTLPQLRVVLV